MTLVAHVASIDLIMESRFSVGFNCFNYTRWRRKPYWRISLHIRRKIAEEGWGQGSVAVLAEYIRAPRPYARGFSASNLWRMTQFYET